VAAPAQRPQLRRLLRHRRSRRRLRRRPLPLHAVTAEEVDRILGSVHALADGAFNALLEMGFATAIRKEWAWRTSRGESTANLAAFHHLVQPAGSGTPAGRLPTRRRVRPTPLRVRPLT
jgi:hypothetical protein